MKPTAHDPALWEALSTLAKANAPELREGRMFGSPAIYVGKRMACCVVGREVGLRVPAAMAEAAQACGRASAFTPYGRPPMREWIALRQPAQRLREAGDLIAAALAFARKNDQAAG